MSNVVVIGGTAGLGRELAAHYAGLGHSVVLSGRDAERAEKVAAEVGGRTRGIALDLTRPHELVDALADLGQVDRLVLVAIERDLNTIGEYDVAKAVGLVTLKLVGYTTVVHALAGRFTPESSVLLYGGMAKDRPYPGSTNTTIVNAGVVGMVKTMLHELKPVRVNAIHPGAVGDSPFWKDKHGALDAARAQTPTGRLVTMAEVVEASVLLLENRALNGVDLVVDGGLTA
ncbi:SDR family NAD(P)-dependent oxidoreductase [Umezawaea tangerina]|uniref:NAD(P)-dependent dehydrogenase (Short-subunit alcohol dehydrogenase family) n=1 Tax=Umezawaea tangerina TaxID=84725 RepID=A0A2T0SX52_9PSEU|nr:SDR family oxidoreductase [Umezawaea tangerina]PRY37997.1 NAD(P)-dependent dehydrogenase (short-subunit alcohol dehydrogenase family) [Umezawaea tangerina]